MMSRPLLPVYWLQKTFVRDVLKHSSLLANPTAFSLSASQQVVHFCCHHRQFLLHSLRAFGKYGIKDLHSWNLNVLPVFWQQLSLSCNLREFHVHHTDNRTAERRTQADLSVDSKSTQKTNTPSSGSERHHQPHAWSTPFSVPVPHLNWEFLCNPSNSSEIHRNIVNRKGVGDIDNLCRLWERYHASQTNKHLILWEQVLSAGLDIPNSSHIDSPVGEESKAAVVDVHSHKREFEFEPKTAVELGEHLQLLRTDNVALTTGPRTYYFLGECARLEQALVQFTLEKLKQKGFQLVSVPDLLHPDIIESCGFKTQGERTQVYRLNNSHGMACLAGTAEMSLAGLFVDEVLDINELPKKVAAVSRCYRAETADIAEEKGIYRVHQFTKVEMFGVTAAEDGNQSDQLLHEIINIERELFISLGLHFRILNMPTEELGAPAYCKYDIETWMPAKGFWGEISSASNCTDFQSRRLNIRYKHSDGNLQFAHTVNGTACAVPRMVMALLECNQQQDGSVQLPKVLHPYMASTLLVPPLHKDPFVRIQAAKKR